MIQPKQPWSIKGVDHETREAAKLAARRANLTLGAWLSRCIRAAAAEQLAGSRGRPAEPQLPAIPMDVLLEAIQRQTDEMKAAAEAGAMQALAPVATQVRELAEKMAGVDSLNERIATAETKAASAALTVAPLERAVSRLSERLNTAPPTEPRRQRGLMARLFGGR